MLGAVLVWLIISGRKEEAKQAAAGTTEALKDAKLSATRIVAPGDLEAVESDSAGTETNQAALVIRNRGSLPYHGVLLQVSCLGNKGEVLATKIRLVPDTIPPGQSVTVKGPVIEEAAPGTVRYGISIVYADLGPAQ